MLCVLLLGGVCLIVVAIVCAFVCTLVATSKFPYVTTFSFATHGETEPALSAGDGVLHIVYRGELNDQMAGFYRSKCVAPKVCRLLPVPGKRL